MKFIVRQPIVKVTGLYQWTPASIVHQTEFTSQSRRHSDGVLAYGIVGISQPPSKKYLTGQHIYNRTVREKRHDHIKP